MSSGTVILPTGISRYAVNAVVVTTVLTALGIITAALRFMLRKREALGTDDYVLMVALFFLILQLISAYLRMILLFHIVATDPLRPTNALSYCFVHMIGWTSCLYRILRSLTFFEVAFLGGEGWSTEDLAKHPERITKLLQVSHRY